jgi:hypothetical protein
MKIRFYRRADEGIALVITLIMLAVTLVMAVAFLAISNRERGSVTTGTDANHARLATDAALANAEGQIIANMLSTTNPYNFDLLVSTNFINRYGYNPAVGANPTNVNYDYTYNGQQFALADMQQNIANLEYLPRAPVFVPTNNLGSNDFRFYLDLNRNRQFDDTGPVLDWMFINGTFTTNTALVNQIGDPQWIGVLEHPDQPHGPLNRFIARYAFIAIPVGNTLDVNAIYNDALMPDHLANLTMKPTFDGYLRNEGVGSWELNLAAFLTDLNTNQWGLNFTGNGYNYNTPYGLQNNVGAPFEDALAMLRYRYETNINSQLEIEQLYGNFPQLMAGGGPLPPTVFKDIDNYSIGPLMTNNTLPYLGAAQSPVKPWAGADNTNHFASLSDFFNPNIFRPAAYNISPNVRVFTDRLLNAGTNIPAGADQVPTYDRYTFYRMLSQLGTESEPQVGKININYTNVDLQGDVQPIKTGNLVPWGTNSLGFFNLAADTLLRNYTTNWFNASLISGGNVYPHYYFTNTFGATNTPGTLDVYTGPFGITNIPVWVNGQFVYTPAVHRLLQLAANIYDATTNGFYPSVFRPMFSRDALTGNIFINGYTNIAYVSGTSDPLLSTPVDITALSLGNIPTVGSGRTLGLNNVNVYGVPWIIGAKKGLPSFNQLYMQNNIGVNRKMEVLLPGVNGLSSFSTNKQYNMGITNLVGMSFWNSYYSNYFGGDNSGNITVYFQDTMTMAASNAYLGSNGTAITFSITTNMSYWPGSLWTAQGTIPQGAQGPYSPFVSVVFTNVFLAASAYVPSGTASGGFVDLNLNPPWTTNTLNYTLPQMALFTTNRAQAYVLDGVGARQHVVDYVHFSGPNVYQNIATNLTDPNSYGMWSTNGFGRSSAPPTFGEVDQILYSAGIPGYAVPQTEAWGLPAATIAGQQEIFNAYITGKTTYNGQPLPPNSHQAPYTPQRLMSYYTNWVANDPLVHYLSSDLNYINPGSTGFRREDNGTTLPANWPPSLSQVSPRYQPWGYSGQMAGLNGADTNQFNLAFKDPAVTGSDAWNFPTNLFPNIGWLGRVHRGTPWQTVYLKSTNLLSLANYQENTMVYGLPTWQYWTGDTGNSFDASNSAPVFDRWLFDLFTAGPNQNATLGQLSVNQTHLAAWSAVFSGIPVYTNLASTNLTIFPPAGTNGVNSELGIIWNSIQQTRSNTNQFPSQSFTHLGDVLAAPALSDASPFLTPLQNDPVQLQYHSLINEQMYEWLPQETLGLLKLGTPRYVIYCYGQALKPAQNPVGILASGQYALMCTNYTVVSESAVRAVVEIQGTAGGTPHVVLKNVNPLPPDQ